MLIQKIELFYKILRTVRSWAGAVVWGAVCMVIAQAVAAKEEAATNAWRGEVPAARYLIDLDNDQSRDRVARRFANGDGRDADGVVVGQTTEPSTYWLAIDVPPVPQPRRVVLALPHPGLERAVFYWPVDKDEWSQAEAGRRVPMAQWPVSNVYPAFEWVVRPGVSRLYLSVQHPLPLALQWQLWDLDAFDDLRRSASLAQGAVLGGVALMVLLAAAGWTVWHHRLPWIFILCASSVGGAALSLGGLDQIGLASLRLAAMPAIPWVAWVLAVSFMLLFVSRMAVDRLSHLAFRLLGWLPAAGLCAAVAQWWATPLSGLWWAGVSVGLLQLAGILGLSVWLTWRQPRVGGWLLAGTVLLLAGLALAAWGSLLGGGASVVSAQSWLPSLAVFWGLLGWLNALWIKGRQFRDEALRRRVLAQEDALTGLASQRVALERLAHLIQRQRRHPKLGGIMRVRVVNLDEIRKSRGPKVAEAAILHAGDCVSQLARRGGDTLGRLDNGDFLLLMEGDTTPPTVQAAAQFLVARGMAETENLPPGVTLRLNVVCLAGRYPGLESAALAEVMLQALDELMLRHEKALHLLMPEGGPFETAS